jgi:hypothetical protein
MHGALTLAVVLALSASGAYAKSCKDPKIGKFITCPAAAAPATTATKPRCTTGVPCGNSCIAKGKVCHKPLGETLTNVGGAPALAPKCQSLDGEADRRMT